MTHVVQQGSQRSPVVQRQALPSVQDLAASERQHAELYRLLPTTLKQDIQIGNLVIAFTAAFLDAAAGGIDLEVAERVKEEVEAPLNQPLIAAGYYGGVVEGAIKDLGDNIVMLWEIVSWLFWHLGLGSLYTYPKMAYDAARDPRKTIEDMKSRYSEIREFFEGLEQFARGLDQDPAFMIEVGTDLGTHAGKLAAEWYMTDFAPASPFQKGRMMGVPVGYLVMEIALMFLGPEEWIIRGGTLAAKLGLKGTKAARRILEILEKIPGLGRVLRSTGVLSKGEELVKGTRVVEEGIEGARRGLGLVREVDLIPGENELLKRTKGLTKLDDADLAAELRIADRVEARPNSAPDLPQYDREVELPNGHVWRFDSKSGKWCRFSGVPTNCHVRGARGKASKPPIPAQQGWQLVEYPIGTAVPRGSEGAELMARARAYREAERWSVAPEQNVAVVLLENPITGELSYLPFHSVSEVKHAESALLKLVKDEVQDLSRIKALYSELSPCASCADELAEHLAGIPIYYSFDYSKPFMKEARIAQVESFMSAKLGPRPSRGTRY